MFDIKIVGYKPESGIDYCYYYHIRFDKRYTVREFIENWLKYGADLMPDFMNSVSGYIVVKGKYRYKNGKTVEVVPGASVNYDFSLTYEQKEELNKTKGAGFEYPIYSYNHFPTEMLDAPIKVANAIMNYNSFEIYITPQYDIWS